MKSIMLRAVLGVLTLVGATAVAPDSAVPSLDTLLARIEARNPFLQTFQARVHVNVRQLNFPWLSPKLDGTAYYKRPNLAIVFDRVPSYARGFNKLFSSMADTGGWSKEWNLSVVGLQEVDSRSLIAVRMTKRIYSDQTREAFAYIDPATYQVARMEWHYFNGGSIVMTQQYAKVGQYQLISSQHAEIHIPHVRALAEATYSQYHTNVPVADSVFTPQPK